MLIKNLFKYWTYQAFSPGTVLRQKYEAFKTLLEYDKRAHELMAELEEIYHDQVRVDFSVIEKKYAAFSRCVFRIVESLQQMIPSRHLDLKDYARKFDFYVRFMLSPPEFDFSPPFTLPLRAIPDDAQSRVGGKAMNLALLSGTLGLPAPEGFAVTTSAFYYFMEYNDLKGAIDERLSRIDIRNTSELNRISGELTALITGAKMPPDIEAEIHSTFRSLFPDPNPASRVAVRSSAVGEDGRASFAGQYRTMLNVRGADIPEACKQVIASKYSPEAIYYRIHYGLTDMETPMAVLVLEMIDAAVSGVMYTSDLADPDGGHMEIHSISGLGELLVQGAVSPDIFTVKKTEPSIVVGRKPGGQRQRMVPDPQGDTRMEPVPEAAVQEATIGDGTVLTLAQWGRQVESHYGDPRDIEWCIDPSGGLFLLQSRPLQRETTGPEVRECNIADVSDRVLVSGGDRASSGVGAGKVFHVRREADLDRLPENTVLVARHASSGYAKILDKLSAVVTDTGSTAGHFASIAREFGVPVLVNTGSATQLLEEKREVTVFADEKKVYDGVVHSLLENQCIRKNLMADSPFLRRLEYVIRFVSPLRLLDPESEQFVPSGCRSFHDIVRFAHEKAVAEMFTIGNRRTGRRMGARKLVSPIPMLIYLLDVGGGLNKGAAGKKEIRLEHIRCEPFLAVWKGLSHPGIQWSSFTHFNWEEYDRIAMSGGIVSADSAMLASYVVISDEYLNLNLKFGYHFVILDTICGERTNKNHILFRFAGGGGDAEGRSMRADFLCRILERLGFWVSKKSDLVDARFENAPFEVIARKLDWLGRLLGATRLMDMYLKEPGQVANYAEEFIDGRYHFSTVEMDE